MGSSNKKRSSADSSEHVEKKKKKPKKNAEDPTGVASSGKDMEKKKKRKASSSLPELPLSYFRDLASLDASVREAAATSLVSRLQEIQKQYDFLPDKESVNGGLMLEAEKKDGLDHCAPPLRYALRRLIRGVSSSRECARQGFALGLTLPVGMISSISVESLLKLVSDNLCVSSSMKGQDVKESLLGRLFAYGALARSGRLIEDWQTDKDSQIVKEFTNALISLTAKKRYLQEPGVHVLLDFIEKLPVEAVVTHVMEAPELHKWFEQATEVGNPDALLLALKLREKISVDHTVFGKLLPVPFSSSKFFSADHLSAIGDCLKESTFCQPRVHSLWSVIADMLLPEDVIKATNNIRSFCENFMEATLLTSSHDRKHLAFDILLLLLPKLPASFLQHFLSFKFVQCLMDILSTKDSWLHKVATYFLEELMDWLKGDDTKRVAVTMALQRHSEGKFDNITRTKTVKDLAGEFETEDGCMLFLQNLMNLFVDEPSSWVIESLPGVLKLSPEEKLRVQNQIMKFLAVQGLFVASLGNEVTSFELEEKFKWPEIAVPTDLCKMCIEQLQLLLSNSQKIETPLSDDDDPVGYFMKFLSILQSIPSVSHFRSLNEADEKAVKELQETESKLLNEERNCGVSADANKYHALRHLVVQLLLQIFLHPGEFSEAASELALCCDKAFGSSFDLLESDGESDSDDEEEEEPAVMDVLVDILLSLLPHSSAPLRSSIEQVFKCFCQDITNDGLMRMMRVIKKDLKPARHLKEDQDSEDLDDDEEDLLVIEEEEEEDEEMGETGESNEDIDDSDREVPDNSDDSEEDDDGMDDDAMFRMDTYLAQIFKEKKKKNQAGGETAQSQLVLFKLRVLSLLEIYLHENPESPQVMTVYLNLAQALVNPSTAESSQQLLQRIYGIIQKKIFKAKELFKDESLEISALASLLEKNLKLAAKPFKSKKSGVDTSKKKQSAAWKRHKMISSLAQNSIYWVLKIIDTRKFEESELEMVLDVFSSVLVGYFDSKKSQIKVGFLKEVFRRKVWIAHKLFGFLVEKSVNPKVEFRRVEALELISEALRSLVPISKETRKESKKMKVHLRKLSLLVKELVANMRVKQVRRVKVRKFCGRVFRMVSSLKLTKSFLKGLGADGQRDCETFLGDLFLNLKNT